LNELIKYGVEAKDIAAPVLDEVAKEADEGKTLDVLLNYI